MKDMSNDKSKNIKMTDSPKDGAKKYIATMLMFIGLFAFAIIVFVFVFRMTVKLDFA